MTAGQTMEYNFSEIEKKWQKIWNETHIYEVNNNSAKPSFYVLDMFPYPSGAGLHVGHPLGYIASDIYARYKRLKGFNVLHTIGFDSFGLPAEQYALETGQHPAETTENNINTYKRQLQMLGFCYDWSRELRTSDPEFYKWTQWIFLQLFDSWYNKATDKAEPLSTLLKLFETSGTSKLADKKDQSFTAEEWKAMSERQQHDVLMEFRLAFSSYGEVNWCEELGTVLANDEVINGRSERGGYLVVKKKMRQWYLRITDYADRLLEGLNTVDYTDSMKEMQTNWIGRSEGANIVFKGESQNANGTKNFELKIYTTRPDTIFGVDFMVLAPEHDLVQEITTSGQKAEVNQYLEYVKSRSERERLSETKKITGCFTGAYCINPISGKHIPVWTSEYVLSGYGTGAIMAVPCGDQRDFDFATHFDIPITNIIGKDFNGTEANPTKDAILENSDFMNGLVMKKAIGIIIDKLESEGLGTRKVNYKMRDAGYSRQRYWGEPFPIIWRDEIAYPLSESELPLLLPKTEKYKPGKGGEGPLSNLHDWVNTPDGKRETSTMPGYAGSSWYFLRYMDPHNDREFASRKATDYWNQVKVYIGGTEHAVGHLLYSRMWTKFLYDRGYISFQEPYKKLINQGMITGKSYFFRRKGDKIISWEGREEGDFVRFKFGHRAVSATGRLPKKEYDDLLGKGILAPAEQEIEWEKDSNGEYIIVREVAEKMSKSKFNVDNPDDIVARYGADTFRVYEMFLGPIEQSKPWNTKGIEGSHRFLKKLWRLFNDEVKGSLVTDEVPTHQELKLIHQAIKKVGEDIESFSFNTAVSALMICVNELTALNCHKKQILTPLLVILSPFAPHLAEELYHESGNSSSVIDANFPEYNPAFLVESEKEYPISVNGKVRANISISLDATQAEVEKIVLENEVIRKWMNGKPQKRIIYVKNRVINVVI